jgi:hypothetical protein
MSLGNPVGALQIFKRAIMKTVHPQKGYSARISKTAINNPGIQT